MLLLKGLIALGLNWISVQIQLECFLGAAGKVSLQSVCSKAKENLVSAQRREWLGGWDFIFFSVAVLVDMTVARDFFQKAVRMSLGCIGQMF